MALPGGDDIDIHVRLRGAREAAGEAKIVEASVSNITDESARLGTTSERSSKKVSVLKKGLGALAVAAKWAGAAIAVASGIIAYKSVNAAVDLGEQINKTKVVFEGASKRILAWSEDTATALGISRREALEYAGVFGNMLVPMGIAEKQAGKMSTSLVDLAADMASFNNADPAEVLDALRAGLAGETEPLRRFGVFLSADRVALEAKKKGLSENYQELTAGQKALVGYNIILKDTKKAHGDFARTSTSLANQQRIFKAQMENLSAKLGKFLLPILTKVAVAVSTFLTQLEKGEGVGGDVADVFVGIWTVLKDVWIWIETASVAAYDFVGGIEGIVDASLDVKDVAVLVYKELLGAILDVVQWVKTAALNFAGFVTALWPVKAAVLAIKLVLFSVLTVIKWLLPVAKLLGWTLGKFLSAAVDVGVGAIQIIWGLFKTFGAFLGNIIGVITSLLRGDFAGAWRNAKEAVVGVVQGIWGAVKGAFGLVRTTIGNFVGYIGELPGKLAGVGMGMFDFIKESFKGAINFVIEAWNNLSFTLPEIDPPGPGPTFGGGTISTPDIPLLAQGGKVLNPGMAIVGDAGPEILRLPKAAVVEPLVRPSMAGVGLSSSGGAMGAERIVYEMHTHVHLDGKEVAENVTEHSEDELARK